ncbi:HDIG domain-containing protein [Paludibacter sp. 221]|uniref:HDIG domain-containing metalloprotein n=1 Tax=Paludibacter sp. 221 TaxID=2302939 RepID=UPI0013D78E1D|nr:HDIG domain-containing metalloprotein [Paludibacter sp. 221]NDV47870.1 HDIG domain-containing protein [Paludibacter sp. 221]
MVDTDSIIRKYYQDNEEAYAILVKHSKQVRDYALKILDTHPELGSLNREFISEAAMLHDVGIFMCDAPGIHCYGTHQYIEHGYLGAELMRKEGLPKHALVCERHTGTGISLEAIIKNNYPLPHRNMEPVSSEEKLICYADKFFSKSKPDIMFTSERIREKLKKFGEKEVAKFDEMHEMFKINI